MMKKKQSSPRVSSKKRSRNQGHPQSNDPVVLAVILSQPDIGCPKFPFLRGGIRIEPDQEKIVKNVLALSVEFLQLPLPDYFEILACQVFYNDHKIEEIRLSLRYPSDSEDLEITDWKDWSTPVSPQFDIRADGVPILKSADERRPYLAGYRIESYFFFSWDVAENAFHEPEKGVKLFSLDIPLSSQLADERENDQIWPFNDEIFKEAWRLLSQVPLSHITNVLLPCPLVEPGQPFRILVDREAGVLGLTSDASYVRQYLLGQYFARSARINTFDVEKYARIHSLSSDAAKVELLLENLAARDRFTSEGFPIFKTTAMHFLVEQYLPLFQQSATRALKEWKESQKGMKGSVARTEDHLIKSSRKATRRILGLQGPGYPRNRKRTRKQEEIEENNREHREKILAAIRGIYDETFRKTKDEDVAERSITRIAIAKMMGKPRSTLDNWLKSGGWEFDDLKAEVLRSAQRKT